MNKEILKKLSRRYTLDTKRNEDFQAYDDMVNMVYEFPDGLANRKDLVEWIDPGAHDSEKIAVNIYDTFNPKWEITPRGPDDKDNAEKLERWVEWQMMRANTHGETEPFRKSMTHCFRYAMTAMQLDYLPYWLPKNKKDWSKTQKASMEGGPFCVTVHEPSTVHYEMGSYGLRWVGTISYVPAASVIDHWSSYANKKTDEGKKITSAIKRVEDILDEDEEAYVTLVDYTDHEKRYVACWHTTMDTVDFDIFDDEAKTQVDVIDIINGENKLPFINWVVSVGASDSLLSTLHKGGLWANRNLSETLKRTAAYSLAFAPKFIKSGMDGDVEIDYTGENTVISTPPGTNLAPIPAIPLDPMWNELSAQDGAIASATTSTQNLTNMGGGSNVQYATINAIIQVNMTQLTSYKRTEEKALTELGRLCFKWIKFSGGTEKAYRKASASPEKIQGEQIDVGPEDFDEDTLFVSAELLPNTPTDKMSIMNIIAQLVDRQAPIPWSEHLEKLGYKNPEAMKDRWTDDQMFMFALKNFSQQQDAALQLQMREAEAKIAEKARVAAVQNSPMSQEANPQNQAKGMPTPPVIPGGQSNNPAQGGASPAMSAPEMTRSATEQPQ
ncbi:MAG: hypothetical protein WC714_28920 [Candidatus Obscuribacterales bacterium]|jgi:hypothetical protein